MKEKIKNTRILEKTVRPDKAQMLKQVQHDMEVVQGDMVVQDDMGCFRCGFGALAPDKVFSLLTSHFSQKFGFTLAEVLITLGIIGVVAAMTLPSLIHEYQEQVTVNKVKKFYSLLSQAIQRASVDNGMPDEWNLPPTSAESAKILYEYLKPTLKIAKDCIQGSNENCVPNYNFFRFNMLNGSDRAGYNEAKYGKLVLADGSLFWFRTSSGGGCKDSDAGYNDVCALFWYDTNGSSAPNVLGKDIFVFVLRPYGLFTYDYDDCNMNNPGWGCARYILEHGNMDYLSGK